MLQPKWAASGNILSGSIGWPHIAADAVRSGHVASGAIPNSALASGVIDWTKLSSGAVRSGHLGNQAVTSGNYSSGSIDWPHLVSGLVSGVMLSGRLGSGSVPDDAIASGVVDWTKLSSGAVRSGHLGNQAVTSGNYTSGSIDWSHLASGLVSGIMMSGRLGSGSVPTNALASGVIDWTKLNSGVVRSGHIDLNAVGVLEIQDGQVFGYYGLNQSPAKRHIASGSLAFTDFASGGIFSGALGNDSVNSLNYSSGSIGETKLASGVLAPFIAAGASAKKGLVPAPESTAHTNNPFLLTDMATFVTHSGKVLGSNSLTTQESTTSTSFVDLATVQSVTFTLDVAGDVLIYGGASYVNTGSATAVGLIAADVDGSDTVISQTEPKSTSSIHPLAGCLKVTGLTAAAHTVKLQFRVTAGTGFFSDRYIIIVQI